MTPEEKKEVLMELGLKEKQAEWYLQYENDTRAVVPAFRLLKPLSDCLEFYKGAYRKLLEKKFEDKSLERHDPEAAEMLRAGVSAKVIEKFAYQLVLEAYESLLYQLDDHKGAEVDDAFLNEIFDKCGYARLCEMDSNGKPTGRYLFDVHGLIPFSDLG